MLQLTVPLPALEALSPPGFFAGIQDALIDLLLLSQGAEADDAQTRCSCTLVVLLHPSKA